MQLILSQTLNCYIKLEQEESVIISVITDSVRAIFLFLRDAKLSINFRYIYDEYAVSTIFVTVNEFFF